MTKSFSAIVVGAFFCACMEEVSMTEADMKVPPTPEPSRKTAEAKDIKCLAMAHTEVSRGIKNVYHKMCCFTSPILTY